MKRALLAIIVIALFLAHQDIWFWRSADPLLFGFLPPALWYHALYSIAAAGLMWALVKYAWPSSLERYASESEPPSANDSAGTSSNSQNGRLRDEED